MCKCSRSFKIWTAGIQYSIPVSNLLSICGVMFCVNLIDDLPVVQDNRKAEPQKYNDEVMREVNCEKNNERDEYIQKKKPKGKAKFIGQSKAEKVMI
jgi:hypothetical protein